MDTPPQETPQETPLTPPSVQPLATHPEGEIGPPSPTSRELTKGEEVMVGLFDVDDIGAAFHASRWDIRAEVELLAGVALNGAEKTSDRLTAARQLRRVANEGLRTSGLVAAQEDEAVFDDGEGRSVRITRRTTNLLSRIRKVHDEQSRQLTHGEVFEPRAAPSSQEDHQDPPPSGPEGSGGDGSAGPDGDGD